MTNENTRVETPPQPGIAYPSSNFLNSATTDLASPVPRSSDTELAPVRYHDMDSLRAAMMLLGLVFHAAWFFIPFYFGNTLSDVAASRPYLYFFCWVHQFRMQVFFLIAGFFACLLIRKRGMRSFAKNRFMRVVIPFALAMLTLWPIMKLQFIRGGLESGRILSDQPTMTLFWNALAGFDWRTERISHLWFLKTLILIYGIAWVLLLAFEHGIDRNRRIRTRLEAFANRLAASHTGPFLLAIPLAFCLAYNQTWFGINSGSIKPIWMGVIAYWIFFAVGWCLYAKPDIINLFTGRWVAYLLLGTVISIGLASYFERILMTGKISWRYPGIVEEEIDYPKLRANLLAASTQPDGSSNYGEIWNLLSPAYQDFLRDKVSPTSDQLTGFARELTTATVMNSDFASAVSMGTETARVAASGTSTAIENNLDSKASVAPDPVANRKLLEQVTDGLVVSRWSPPLWILGTYFYGYAVASWLMTFAMLGLFRRFLSNPSPRIRYLADSSYWLYLIHLPLQFEISIQLGLWQAPSLLKFLIYNIVTFAILLPTYHYLVRPTWLGFLLNGRLYPLRRSASAGT